MIKTYNAILKSRRAPAECGTASAAFRAGLFPVKFSPCNHLGGIKAERKVKKMIRFALQRRACVQGSSFCPRDNEVNKRETSKRGEGENGKMKEKHVRACTGVFCFCLYREDDAKQTLVFAMYAKGFRLPDLPKILLGSK